MAYNPQFGPAAQTRHQRTYVLRQLEAVPPYLKTKATVYARHLYARYIVGELTDSMCATSSTRRPIVGEATTG